MIIPVNFAQVVASFSGSGVPTGAAITFGVGHDGTRTPTQVATAIRNNIQTNLMPPLIQNTGLAKVLVKFGPNETGPTGEANSTTAGGDTSAQASPNVAYLVSKKTALGGRKNRGRFYLPGVDETEVDQTGLIGSTKVTALQNGCNAFMTQLGTDALLMHLLHNDATLPTLVTSLEVSTIVATQRRRLRR